MNQPNWIESTRCFEINIFFNLIDQLFFKSMNWGLTSFNNYVKKT